MAAISLDVAAFRVGHRVQVHPCTDAWMRGDRFGEVVSIGRRTISVKLDKSQRVVRFVPSNITHIL